MKPGWVTESVHLAFSGQSSLLLAHSSKSAKKQRFSGLFKLLTVFAAETCQVLQLDIFSGAEKQTAKSFSS